MDEVAKVIDKELLLKYEDVICDVESCFGCKVLEDCADAIKHTRNILKKRLSGAIGHEEFMRLNDERFGPAKPRLIKHWKQVLGSYESEFIKVVNNPSLLEKMPVESQDFHRGIEKQLIYHGWVQPTIESGQLKFKTIYPKGKDVEKAIGKGQDEPELDDDFIPEQGELI